LLAAEPEAYRRTFLSAVDAIVSGRADRGDAAELIAHSHINVVAHRVYGGAIAWSWTGEQRYADFAVANLKEIATAYTTAHAAGKTIPEQDSFFLVYPLLSGFDILDRGGKIEPKLKTLIEEFAATICDEEQRGNFNQPLSRAAGQALAMKIFPDAPHAAKWRQAAENVWNDWLHDGGGDTTENALNYNCIFLTYAFVLGDLLGHTQEMAASPTVRAMVERFGDQVSPSGITPGYGDSAEVDNWPFWVAAFERAGATWHDPTFRWAAQQIFAAGMKYRAGGDSPQSSVPYPLPLALDWADSSIAPHAPDGAATAVLRRHDPRDPQMLDKLVLGPSREPGAPFLVSDLYAVQMSHANWGSHAHPDWGAIEYFETAGVPVLHSLGYNNRSPNQQNLLLAQPPEQSFPYGDGEIRPGQWTEARLPLAAIEPTANSDSMRQFDSVTLRVESPETNELCVKNLRLVGPAGERVIDDFTTQKPAWKSVETKAIETVTDSSDGKRMLVVRCGGTRADAGRPITFIVRSGLDQHVDLSQFNEIRFTWRLKNYKPNWARTFILRVGNHDYQVPQVQLFARTESASAEVRDGDSFGQMTFTDWFASGSRWTRRVVLSREGVLLIDDELTPSADLNGWTAGPIWHLFSPPTKGKNWFDAAGDAKFGAEKTRTLVWFAPIGNEQTLGCTDADLWGGYHPYTVFARQRVDGNRPIRFATLIVPHDSSRSAESIADTITATPDGVGLSVNLGGVPLRFSSSGDAKMSVKR
jgi:hypothetical protein